MLGMDAAASEWRDPIQGSGFYRLPKSGQVYTTDQLIAHWQTLAGRYPCCRWRMDWMRRTGLAGRN